jgi:ATP synthase protein I
MEKIKSNNPKPFSEQIGEKEDRKLKAQREHKRSVWLGFGMFGMVGWSIAFPTVAGATLGLWLDRKYPQTFSWTLTLLLAGLVAGSAIAWSWVAKENREMHKNEKE